MAVPTGPWLAGRPALGCARETRDAGKRRRSNMTKKPVLVVEHDKKERLRIGGILEGEGFGVVGCPGPRAPDYVCAGGLGLPCPIANQADVVVLDLRLGSDVLMRGTPAWELLIYY